MPMIMGAYDGDNSEEAKIEDDGSTLAALAASARAPAPVAQSSLPGLNILNQWSNQIRQDQAAQAKSAVVQEAIKKFHAGDPKGAFATISAVMPEQFAKTVFAGQQAGDVAEATTRGQQTALTEVGANAGQVIDKNNKADIAAAEIRAENRGATDKSKLDKENRQWVSQERRYLTSHDTFKAYQNHQKNKAMIDRAITGKSGRDDMSAIYGYLKTVDPTSVAQRSEFLTASNAGSALDKVKNYLSALKTGETLQPAQRAELAALAKHMDAVYKQNYDAIASTVAKDAKERGIDMKLIDPYQQAERDLSKFDADTQKGIQWALDNPNDARSQPILNKFGVNR